MPALTPQWDGAGEALATSAIAETSRSASALRSESACRCGRRRSVGVLLGMRSGARPRLEGRWYCRKSCLREDLEDKARRDFPDHALSFSRVRHRVPLGLMLQARGVITADQLQRALRNQAATGQRLGDVLRMQFEVPEERITGAIAAQWGLPILSLPLSSKPAPLHVAPSQLFQASGTFPVERKSSGVLLACAEGPDPALALALERMHPIRIEFGLVSSAVLEHLRSSFKNDLVSAQRVRCVDRMAMAADVADVLYQLQPVDSRIVRVNGFWWLRAWLEDAARLSESHVDTVDVLYSVHEAKHSERVQTLSSF